MSFVWSAENMAKVAFPSGRPLGDLLVLSSYFDDSGTHAGSRSVVWGGLLGESSDFSELEARWAGLLLEPLPGRAAIPHFHLTDCVAGRGIFSSYSDVERERVRYLFRDAIVQSPVMAVAYAVDVLAWKRIAPGTPLSQVHSPESCAFGLCVRNVLRAESSHGNGMAMYFDQGRDGRHIEDMRQGAWLLMPEAARTSTFAFMDVKNCLALQAADTVANEFYRFSAKYFEDELADHDPHFRSFLDKLSVNVMGVMQGAELTDLSQKMSWQSSP